MLVVVTCTYTAPTCSPSVFANCSMHVPGPIGTIEDCLGLIVITLTTPVHCVPGVNPPSYPDCVTVKL